ncbi:helix-turn-helix domain-containing protein [Streptomyces sp. NPDC058989]|uniref:helix-turn-helix domain-containing protein n=1 Tax=Streptomyces sp. NPDC058989 TaxID=3346686 RepID=UPI0036A0AA63
MHVRDLLQVDSLDLTLLWGEGSLLDREIRGVTTTDLADPTGLVRPGELVLSGLGWWAPGDDHTQADRFVAALRSAGAAALLAAEKAPGETPGALVDACRAYETVLVAVPARTTFRAVTEAVRPDERRAADELVALVDAGPADGAALDAALRTCGLPASGPYRVVVATLGGADGDGAVSALVEGLRHSPGEPFAAGGLPGGEAVAVVPATPEAERRCERTPPDGVWPAPHALRQAPLHAGVSAPAAAAEGLGSALEQARYALAAARSEAPEGSRVVRVDDLSTMGPLFAGVPADVRRAFSSRVLGPLARGGSASHRMLLETLEVFLAQHGSWSRTAEKLRLHVNTVHYRIQRIEMLTGRDLSRLDHKLDLRAALLCR